MALIDFMQMKNKLLDYELTTKKDMDELKSWPEKDIIHVTEKIRDALLEMNRTNITSAVLTIPPGRLCPWCIVGRCKTCNYGKRNGICSRENSRYNLLLEKEVASSIVIMKLLPHSEKLLEVLLK